ncbi:MAG TPA: alpha/beta hydrolase [Reyranella sp.]|nr:alpha/beta hydrolase [Reyranella sp.]
MVARAVIPVLVAATIIFTGCDNPGNVDRTVAGAASEQSSSSPRNGFAEVEGARIAYQVYGDIASGKTPLVVLHGSLMSAESMVPMVQPFFASRPVIAIDARGHGRTGDVPGPITYERMADDVAAVIRALGIKRADVLGYSMGATTALIAAVRHPDLIDKQVVVSGVSERGGWVPEAQASFEKWNAKAFAGTPIESAYKRNSATPDAFPVVIDKLRQTETAKYDLSAEALRGIAGKTMIVAGDYDGLQLSHALKLFAARGGSNEEVAMKGFLSAAPPARLAIVPGTSHIGMSNEGKLLAQLVVPFLDDLPPAPPSGFFEGVDKSAAKSQ